MAAWGAMERWLLTCRRLPQPPLLLGWRVGVVQEWGPGAGGSAEGLSGVSATCLSPLLGRGPARRCRHEPLLRLEWAWGCAGPRRSAVRAGSGERGGWAQGAGHRATAGPSCSPGASVPRPFPRPGRLCGACASALRQPPGPGPRSPQSTQGTAKPWPQGPLWGCRWCFSEFTGAGKCPDSDPLRVRVRARVPSRRAPAWPWARARAPPRGTGSPSCRAVAAAAPPLLLTGDRAFRRR